MPDSTCNRCGAGNREGRRFCGKCGAALPIVCASCGFANEASEKFCGGCGAPLASTEAKKAVAATSEGERRPVTVLFADLVDYTRMSRALDPEDVHALLSRFYEVADAIVERFGGSIDKHIGDSVMAVFGAPIAHGDEAIRAVRAAADIHRAMPGLTTRSEAPMSVHIGIASGEVVASGLGSARHRAYTVIGNSVNLASRLLKLAHAGETVLDETVHAAVQYLARCVPLDAVEIKGIDDPVVAWRFVEMIDAGEDGGARPFVGRQAELAQLAAFLQSCAASGAGGTVLVRGDAGIGKSRLVGEFRKLARVKGFACHMGLVLDFGMAQGRDAIRELVARMLALPQGSESEARRAALQLVLSQHPSNTDDAPFLSDLLDLPQSEDRKAMYEAMDNAARQRGSESACVHLLDLATRASPVLLVVEDIHWADPVTLGYLAALTRAVADLPAVLALTSRIEGDPLDAAWRVSVQGSPLVTIDLGPLAARDALAFVGGFVSAPKGFAQKCVDRAAGNPLFLDQLMRAADEHDDRLPASLHSLVLARMDRLPERDRAALRAASVIGQRFPLPLVRELAQLPDYRCTTLVDHFLIRPEGDEFLFVHALIRDGVYASLTRARRTELHRAAAEWYGERDPALRAQHLDRAEAPEAARAYLEAARVHTEALHSERALSHAQRGATLATDPSDVVALNLFLGRLWCELGEGKPAVDAYTLALLAAREPLERCRALVGIAAGHRLIANLDSALDALAKAEPIARENNFTRELAELHYTRGNLRFARGDVDACGIEHSAALVHAQKLGDPAWEARAMSGLADADYAIGHMRSAFERFTACVALCEAHGLTRITIPNLAMAGNCSLYLMEFDSGIAKASEAHEIARKVVDRHGEMFALESIGMVLTFVNRYDEAAPVLEEALSIAQSLGARRYQAILLAAMAETLIERGRMTEAFDRNENALALSREFGMRFCGPLILALKARLIDDAAEREQVRREAESLIDGGGLGHNPIGYHRLGIEDALHRGECERALLHASALEAYTREEPLPFTEFLIARARVLIGLASFPNDATLVNELAHLKGRAAHIGWPIRWPTLAAGPRK